MTGGARLTLAQMPERARALLFVVAATTPILVAVTLWVAQTAPTVRGVAAMAAGMLAADLLRIDTRYRRGGAATFGLSDAVLAAGLLVLPAPDVVLGGTIGVFAWNLTQRVPAVKFVANLSQFTLGMAAAALTVHLVGGGPELTTRTAGGLLLGIALFLAINVGTVSGFISLTSKRPLPDVLRRVASTALLVSLGSACMGVLGVVAFRAEPWSLPLMGVPIALLHWASRLDVRAREARERSTAFIEMEQALSDASSPGAVAAALVEGLWAILGYRGAVWQDGSWITPVPEGSSGCPVDASLSVTLIARAPALGPNVEGLCAAVGLGGGVLVAWAGDLPITARNEEWLERIGRSGRVHLERAAAKAALEQERAALRAVVDGTVDGILLLDPAGTIQLWNPAMALLAGVSAEDALGRPVRDVLGDGPWGSEGVHDLVRPDERVWRVSLAELADAVLSDGDEGGASGVLRVGVIHDVSAERRTARMKDDMLAVVSHELRTPLTPIKASAQLLRRRWDRLPDQQRGELLAQIESRADHLTHLVEDLLLVGQLSAAEDAMPTVRPVAVELGDLLRQCIAQLAAAHPIHELTLEAPSSLPTRTDPVRVRQILDNLVDNACKFSPAGSTVAVHATVLGDELMLTVTDQGRGIPSEDLTRIFERFERVEDPLVMTTSGAGLGLYIVRALARALGGDISVRSSLGMGATFTVRLPLRPVLGATDRLGAFPSP